MARRDHAKLIPAAILAHVPGAMAPDRVSVSPLPGGRINQTFLVATPEGRYVVRLGSRASSLPAIDRRAEIAVHRAAAAAGLAPAIVFEDAARDLLITAHAEGRAWNDRDFASPTQLERLATCLHRLHAIPMSGALMEVPALDVAARAREHVETLAAHAPSDGLDLAELLERSAQVAASIERSARLPRLVHGDLHGSNIIDGEQLLLIDWEYAARADPLWDVACLLAYRPEVAPHLPRLLEALRETGDAARARLTRLHWQFQLLNYLWYRSRRLTVAPTDVELAAEERARQSLVNTSSTLPGMWK